MVVQRALGSALIPNRHALRKSSSSALSILAADKSPSYAILAASKSVSASAHELLHSLGRSLRLSKHAASEPRRLDDLRLTAQNHEGIMTVRASEFDKGVEVPARRSVE